MQRLDPAANGRLLIDGQPHQQGSLDVVYDLDAERVSIWDEHGGVWVRIHYSNISNAGGAAFASFVALQTFISENFYKG